jgi:uncharacterized lipoprotein YajG
VKSIKKNSIISLLSVILLAVVLMLLAGCASQPQPVRPVSLSPAPKPQAPADVMKPAPPPSHFLNRFKTAFGLS